MHNKMTTLAGALALAFASSASAQTQTTTPPPVTQDAQPAPAAPAPAASDAASAAAAGKAPMAATELDRVDIVEQRQRLDAARNSLSPETGSTVYRFEQQDIKNLPLGDATPLNQVALQAPGVVQDSFGQLHVRGDHGNLQYRVNGVVIPEAISGFGQALDTRFADRITLITGALPAQYGYRTAGVIDINTKGANLENGGSVDAVAGSRGHREGSASIGGTSGALSYFFSGSYLENDIGIENPTPESSALHDKTRQAKGFGYLSYLLGKDSRISFITATTDNRFQIPDRPGLTPSFTLANATPPASESLDAKQRERNKFQVLSFQSSLGAGLDYQVSLSHRDTDVHYRPDSVGDLVYNGVAAEILRSNEAYGLQADLSKKLNDQHTLRFGLFAQRERGKVDNSSLVFPADANGNQTSTTPETIVDDNRLGGHLYGVYLQDEWKPTPALTVNYGARYDQVDTVVKESQLSPRLGATWQLGENTRLHAGYARYFTPPA
ncbi:MAG TPA: TonB-dependent receptor, partial [Methylibium sp.]